MNDQSLSQNKMLANSSHKSSTNAAGSTGLSSDKQNSQKSQQQNSNNNNNSKIMITGDDILIEYVARLVKALNLVQGEQVQPSQISSMDKFVTHYVWKQPDQIDLN